MQPVAETNPVNVSFLDIRAHPQIVGIDERDDGLAGIDDFALQRGARVHDAADGRKNFRVFQLNLRLLLLRGSGLNLFPDRIRHAPGRIRKLARAAS